MKRPLRPHPQLVIAPVTATQHTAFAVFGFTDRQYLETLSQHREIPRTKVGRLVVVDVEAFRDAMSRMAKAADAGVESVHVDGDSMTPEDVLRMIGRRSKRA